MSEILSDFRLTEQKAIDDVVREYVAATRQFGSMASPHEGWAVIKEELDELWEEVRDNKSPNHKQRLRREAIQVAAMGLRFLVDVC